MKKNIEKINSADIWYLFYMLFMLFFALSLYFEELEYLVACGFMVTTTSILKVGCEIKQHLTEEIRSLKIDPYEWDKK